MIQEVAISTPKKYFSCSMRFYDAVISSDHEAETASKARYAFYKEHFNETSYAEVFKYINVKTLKCITHKRNPINIQQLLIDTINARYTVGDVLSVRQDDGSILQWTMKHNATMLGGHTAVIWVKEHVSCYAADRVIFN